MKVITEVGEVEHGKLETRDLVEWSDNYRIIATEWYLDGKRVRRDVWLNTLRNPEIGVRAGQ